MPLEGRRATSLRAKHFVIGVDGGGSKTKALVADLKGKRLGQGVAGPSNYQAVGRPATYVALDTAIRAACETAGLEGQPRALCLGLAGAGRPEDQAVIQAWADARYPGVPVTIVHDAELVLAAGTSEGWGIALISGTGSLAYGRAPDGHTARAGGWGYIFGDEGSGYAIGVAALRAVAHACDGRGSQTALTSAVLQYWALDKVPAIIPHLYGHAPSEIRTKVARLAPLVTSTAEQGDEVAHCILQEAGKALSDLVIAVVRALDLEPPIPLALAGGVLVKGPSLVATLFHNAIRARGVQLEPLTYVQDPARGAVRIAVKVRASS